MKDLVEVRLTLAAKEIEGKTVKALSKVLKPVGKVIETKLDRIAEALTKIVEYNTKEIAFV